MKKIKIKIIQFFCQHSEVNWQGHIGGIPGQKETTICRCQKCKKLILCKDDIIESILKQLT